jgi:hypothetical protein
MSKPTFLLAAVLLMQWPGDQEIPPVDYPAIADGAKMLEGFVPPGWRLEERALGDLNQDGIGDAALVIQMARPSNRIALSWNPDSRYNTNPRMLLVAFGRKDGGYRLAAANHKIIPRLENPNQDDPFDEIKIVAGTLRVKMHLFMSAGGWQMGGSTYTFRWQDGGFKLIGFDRDFVMRNSGETEEVSINYLTGRKELKRGNIGSDQQQSKSARMRRRPLLDLTNIGDGLMFDPDER